MSNKRTAVRRRPPGRARQSSGTSPWLWVGIGAVVVAAVVMAVVLASGDDGSEQASGEIGSPVAVDGQALPVFEASAGDAAVGQPAPRVEGVSSDGEPVTISGQGPQILVFLAHWCPHCQVEVPAIVAATASPDWPENVTVTGVTTATDNNRENYPPSSWLEDEGWPFPVLADDADSGAAGAYGISGFPYMVFIDADGNIAMRNSGELGAEAFLALADSLSKGEPLTTPDAGASSGA